MVTLLYGENTTASRSQLQSIKEAFAGEVISLDAKNLAPEQLFQALESHPLLETKRLVILENALNKENKDLVERLPVFQDTNLVLWEAKKLTTTQLQSLSKKIPSLEPQEFKLEPIVFKFVESLKPKNQKETLTLLKKYLTVEDIEVAFAMVVRQVRLLLLTKNKSGSTGPDDWQNLSPWQKAKLETQAKFFPTPELFNLYHRLLDLDFYHKSGLAVTDRQTSLELLLLSL